MMPFHKATPTKRVIKEIFFIWLILLENGKERVCVFCTHSITVSSPVPRCGAVLRVELDFGFGAAGSQRGHDAVLQTEGDHLTAL